MGSSARTDEPTGVVRKTVLVVEEVLVDAGRALKIPLRFAAAGCVIVNPLAGRFTEDLSILVEQFCEPLGKTLSNLASAALEREAEAYGKGALVGLEGEVEHGSAIIHNLRFGNHVREEIGGTALIPSAEKRGAAGASLDLPIKHKHDHTVRSHHQSFEVRVPDAPRVDEMVIWVALTSGGRPHARLSEFGTEVGGQV